MKIFSSLIIFFLISCANLNLRFEQIEKPISFSDIPVKSYDNFSLEETYWYWLGFRIFSGKTPEELLNDRLKKYPESRGIKNLEIKIYSNVSESPHSFLMNPFYIFPVWYLSYIMNLAGFSVRSIQIKGEIY